MSALIEMIAIDIDPTWKVLLVDRSLRVAVLTVFTSWMLAVSGCGTGGEGGAVGDGSSQAGRPADIGTADPVFTRPTVKNAGGFTVAATAGCTDCNNNTGAANSLQYTMVLSTVQPSPFFFDRVDGHIVLKRDGDLMDSVEVTSTDPMQVVWKIQPAAVWSDGTPVSCKDFHLQWLAASSRLTRTGGDGTPTRIWDTNPAGYEPISKHACADDGKTLVTDFSTPFADYRPLYAFMVPAHILERATGIADITRLTDADPVAMAAAAAFYNTGWIGFNAVTGLSAGPYRIESTSPNETALVRNETWWAAPGGPSKVTFRTTPDAQAAALQLQNKEVDVIATLADAAVAGLLRK
jgi:peptide/nickel transport system substrate-binding protein